MDLGTCDTDMEVQVVSSMVFVLIFILICLVSDKFRDFSRQKDAGPPGIEFFFWEEDGVSEKLKKK